MHTVGLEGDRPLLLPDSYLSLSLSMTSDNRSVQFWHDFKHVLFIQYKRCIHSTHTFALSKNVSQSRKQVPKFKQKICWCILTIQRLNLQFYLQLSWAQSFILLFEQYLKSVLQPSGSDHPVERPRAEIRTCDGYRYNGRDTRPPFLPKKKFLVVLMCTLLPPLPHPWIRIFCALHKQFFFIP